MASGRMAAWFNIDRNARLCWQYHSFQQTHGDSMQVDYFIFTPALLKICASSNNSSNPTFYQQSLNLNFSQLVNYQKEPQLRINKNLHTDVSKQWSQATLFHIALTLNNDNPTKWQSRCYCKEFSQRTQSARQLLFTEFDIITSNSL